MAFQVFLQKLLRYFNGTTISASFVSLFPVYLVIFSLNLNEILLLLSAGKSIIMSLLLKLVYLYGIAINFLMLANKYCYIVLSYTLALLHKCLQHHLLVYFQVVHPPLHVTVSIHLCPSVCCAPYLRNCTSSDHNLWYTYICEMMISPGIFFFIFSKFYFFGLLRG